MGGAADRFPSTNHSAIVALGSDDMLVRQRAFAAIVESYWKPTYKYIRVKWQASNEDAKDVTQGFFSAAFEKNYFADYDTGKASFQTFLRICLDRFIANQRKSEQRLKRGGGFNLLTFDFAEAENELSFQDFACEISPENYFHQEWVRGLLAAALESLREHYQARRKGIYFRLFQSCDLADSDTRPSYASLAAQFDLTISEVTNYLAATRREFRRIVLNKLRELSATEEEFRSQARSLLGVKVP